MSLLEDSLARIEVMAAGDHCSEPCVGRALFGGAITCSFPSRFRDLSEMREVPNNQETFLDPNRDESIIVELLEFKANVPDEGSSRWFLQDIAAEQDSEQSLIVEQESYIAAADFPPLDPATTVNAAVGTLAIAKGRQGNEARNLVRAYVANIRLCGVETDVLITVYEPLSISEHSESAASVGVGPTVPAELAGCMAAADVFKGILYTFKIQDWSLFGYADAE